MGCGSMMLISGPAVQDGTHECPHTPLCQATSLGLPFAHSKLEVSDISGLRKQHYKSVSMCRQDINHRDANIQFSKCLMILRLSKKKCLIYDEMVKNLPIFCLISAIFLY